MQSGIYRITNCVNGKSYVGSSKDTKSRLRGHLHALRKGNHSNSYMQRAWNKYGEHNFLFATIIVCTISDLVFYEQRAIDGYRTANRKYGYNARPTANNMSGWKPSKATRKLWSKQRLGSKNGMFGRTHTKDVRAQLSEARKRQIHPLLGKHHSEESKRKMSEARKRLYNSIDGEHYKAIIRKSNSKRVDSLETSRKRIEGIQAFYASERSILVREKISQASKKAAALRKARNVGSKSGGSLTIGLIKNTTPQLAGNNCDPIKMDSEG